MDEPEVLGTFRLVRGEYKPPEIQLDPEEVRGQWHECCICGSDKSEQVHQSLRYEMRDGRFVMIDMRSRRCQECGVMEEYDDAYELAKAELERKGGA